MSDIRKEYEAQFAAQSQEERQGDLSTMRWFAKELLRRKAQTPITAALLEALEKTEPKEAEKGGLS